MLLSTAETYSRCGCKLTRQYCASGLRILVCGYWSSGIAGDEGRPYTALPGFSNPLHMRYLDQYPQESQNSRNLASPQRLESWTCRLFDPITDLMQHPVIHPVIRLLYRVVGPAMTNAPD